MTTPQQNFLDLADIERQIDAVVNEDTTTRAARAIELQSLFKAPGAVVRASEGDKAERIYLRIFTDLLNIPVTGSHRAHIPPPATIVEDTP